MTYFNSVLFSYHIDFEHILFNSFIIVDQKMTKTTAKQQENPTKSNKEHMTEVADTLKVTRATGASYNANQALPAYVEPINERELTSVYALLAYVAYNQNVRQETVQMIVEAEFGVDDVSKIRRNDYMTAIEFMVDLKMDEIIN